MGDSACECTDRLHPASLLQARLQTLLLLENDSADGIGYGIERHAKESKFSPLGKRSHTQSVEPENRLRPLPTCVWYAQPALKASVNKRIHGVIGGPDLWNVNDAVLASIKTRS